MKILKYLIVTIFLLSLYGLNAQNDDEYGTMIFDGRVYKTMIIGEDTLILADLATVTIKPTREMTDEELKKYKLYKRSARIAYPYAKDALNILNKLEERTKDMTASKRKKYIEMTYEQLELNFKKQIKNLSKTQGKVMIKMIERETKKSFYTIIKENRNWFSAFYWQQFGKLYDYNLKQGYNEGDDPILDLVLKDYYFKPEDSPIFNVILQKNAQKK